MSLGSRIREGYDMGALSPASATSREIQKLKGRFLFWCASTWGRTNHRKIVEMRQNERPQTNLGVYKHKLDWEQGKSYQWSWLSDDSRSEASSSFTFTFWFGASSWQWRTSYLGFPVFLEASTFFSCLWNWRSLWTVFESYCHLGKQSYAHLRHTWHGSRIVP
jgi:hypothetical protein